MRLQNTERLQSTEARKHRSPLTARVVTRAWLTELNIPLLVSKTNQNTPAGAPPQQAGRR